MYGENHIQIVIKYLSIKFDRIRDIFSRIIQYFK
jgi:hypothetical protein